MIAWRTLLAAAAAVGMVAAGGIAGAAVSSCTLVKVEDWPTRVQRNRLLVEGAINGRKISVMLDTGSMRTLIFRAAAVRLELPLSGAARERIFGVGGETTVAVAWVDEFRVGQAAQKGLRLLVAGEQDPGDDVAVLLGEDFFRQFDVEFDLAHNAVRLFQPKDCDGVSLAYWAHTGASEVEFEALDASRPEIILAVQINGQPLKALLDSGAALSVLDKADAARLGVTPETPGVVVGARSLGMGKSGADSWIGPFRSFTIGNETIQDTQIRLQRHVQGRKLPRHGEQPFAQDTGRAFHAAGRRFSSLTSGAGRPQSAEDLLHLRRWARVPAEPAGRAGQRVAPDIPCGARNG